MSRVNIENGNSGLTARNAINGNFTELYANLPLPIKIAGMAANFNQAIAANVMVTNIFIKPVSGGPVTLRIGTTANGQEILPDTPVSGQQIVNANEYFGSAGTLYFTFSSGSGNLNVRIDVINNFN